MSELLFDSWMNIIFAFGRDIKNSSMILQIVKLIFPFKLSILLLIFSKSNSKRYWLFLKKRQSCKKRERMD